ncbi:MAG: NAD(P)-binding protein [Deltaproteobacteria bacterium]
MNASRDHAVVLGGSVAGLLAAAALSRHYRRVTVLERDEDCAAMTPRRGVPQSAHVHVILGAGRKAIDGLLPGLFDALAADGSVVADIGRDVRWHHWGGFKVAFFADYPMYLQSRPFLEGHIRRRVEAIDGVQLRYGTKGTPVHEGGRVVGVTTNDETIDACLVIDATGRGSKCRAWLEDWGYAAPPEDAVTVNLAYASCFVTLPAPDVGALLVYHQPPTMPRGGVLFPIEGDRYVVSLLGYHGDHPPTDEAEFRAYARSLLHPQLADQLDRATLLTPIKRFNYPKQRRLRYERVDLPRGFAVIGDAVCSFDPVFGQGMTVAGLTAAALDRHLAAHAFDGRRFQSEVAKCADLPWMLATNEAFRYPQTEGTAPWGGAVLRWFTGRVFAHSLHDEVVYRRFIDVLNLDRGPSALMGPGVVARVLRPLPER